MKFSAVILAGGKSSRMGRDKAFLEISGCSLLGRQIDTLVAAGAAEVFISGRSDVDYSTFGCRVLADEFSGAGPLAGIHAALKFSRQPLTLVLAVDLPEMNAVFLRGLLMASSGGGVIPCLDGKIEPLAALYPKAAEDVARRMLGGKNFAARDFAAACVRAGLAGYFSVSDEFDRFFRNLNSPEDLSGIFVPSLPRGIIHHG